MDYVLERGLQLSEIKHAKDKITELSGKGRSSR